MIKLESIEELNRIVDITDIIGLHLELIKSGSHYKAICPFHDEKTPSLVITPIKNLYYCFGCGAHGNVFHFLMEYEKLTFQEAVEKVARFYHFSLQYTQQRNPVLKSDYLERMTFFFMQCLQNSPKVLEYVENRYIAQSSQERFMLGYAPSASEIMQFIYKENIPVAELFKLGFLGEDKGRFYPRFVQRLIFPITSSRGEIVGFGGRRLQEEGQIAKYINSPQTPLFNKSKLLYAYSVAREAILQKKRVIVTEGYIDVILLHQAGFNNAVATLGTSLTKEHLPLLSRGEPRILLAYDGDKAGRAAAFRAAKLLTHKDGGVVLFKDGVDPADMVAQKRIEEIKSILENFTPFILFLMQEILASHNLKNPIEKRKALEECEEILRDLPPILQEEYSLFLSHTLQIPQRAIRLKNNKKRVKAIHLSEPKDPVLANILKMIIQDIALLDSLLEYVDTPVFQGYEEEFELLKQNNLEAAPILKIMLDEQIVGMDKANLKKQVCMILDRYYRKQLVEVAHQKTLSSERRSFLLDKIRLKLQELQKGELPQYESFSTF
ncbi:DNA primase [Helicobacter monodelphidis]|uniref:DNA primase n=1 Tax=Helicobacter sp. 15-1451 TaxID=2004995 RepID=UPI000DCB4BF3|nr:DNA primase [Helicobacter sp. 15-1451]RAX57620.1 DNA primase [Helicobacter sp. 15-1451]